MSTQTMAPGLFENVSKIFHELAPGEWEHIPIEPYKKEGADYKGITRRELVGKRGESIQFHVRYFEIEPGGYSSYEWHEHEHVVFVLRGNGEVRLGCRYMALKPGDFVYVKPKDPHQFLNHSSAEVFGFLCMVHAERDRPQSVEGGGFCEICV